MADHNQVPPDENRANDSNATDKKPNFMGIPLTGWAIVAVSFIVVLYVAGHFGFKLYGDWQDALAQKAKSEAKATQAAAVNADTSAYSNAVTKEMDRHKHDGSGHLVALHGKGPEEIFATYFDSDGCIAIGRPGVPLPYQPSPQATLEWSLGPDRRPSSNPPNLTTPITGASTPVSPKASPIVKRTSLEQSDQTYKHSDSTGANSSPRLIRIQAGCWVKGVHPWTFRTWWGPANGCWAPLYRQWKDGCTHYQMFNACNGQWDPRIVWTFCNPKHHP